MGEEVSGGEKAPGQTLVLILQDLRERTQERRFGRAEFPEVTGLGLGWRCKAPAGGGKATSHDRPRTTKGRLLVTLLLRFAFSRPLARRRGLEGLRFL